MSFMPDPLISEVLGLLREEGLTWISEEVEEAIAAGNPETFIVREFKLRGQLRFELYLLNPGERRPARVGFVG